MAHHGSETLADKEGLNKLFSVSPGENTIQRGLEDKMRGLMNDLGATGRFPLGKLTPDDEGEIRISVGGKEGRVVLDFGKPIAWIGFTPEQARDIGSALFTWANRMEH